MKSWRRTGAFLGIALLSGCSRQTVNGDSTTYGHGWLPIILIFAVMVAMIGIGIAMAVENRQIAAKQSRRKKKNLGPQEDVGATGLIVGSLLAVGGVFGLLLVVPSMLFSYVTVSPDKVVIRDSLLWFSGSAREIPYSDISGMSVAVEEVFTRKGRREKHLLTINRISGRGETIEMNGMHKAAWPDWQARYEAFTGNGHTPSSEGRDDSILADAQSSMSLSANTPPVTDTPSVLDLPTAHPSQADLSDQFGSAANAASNPARTETAKQVIPQRAFAKPGAMVQAARPSGQFEPATVIEVYADSTVKIQLNRTGQFEVVQFGQLLPLASGASAPSAIGNGLPDTSPGTSGDEVKVSKMLSEIGQPVRLGEKVAVGTMLYKEYANRWSAVSVVRVGPGSTVRIHWLGWDDTWDEDVEVTTLRKPK